MPSTHHHGYTILRVDWNYGESFHFVLCNKCGEAFSLYGRSPTSFYDIYHYGDIVSSEVAYCSTRCCERYIDTILIPSTTLIVRASPDYQEEETSD